MMEKLNEAFDELKRVDHLIYVSLKYTRTVDVILNILSRMVDGYALIVDSLLTAAKENGVMFIEPESALERAELIRSMYGADQVVSDNMGLYILLRKLLRAKNIVRENEYRRHVTMKTVIDGREEIVNIDIITNYCLFQREFLMHARSIVEGKVAVELRSFEATPTKETWDDETMRHEERDEITVIQRTAPKRSILKVRPVGAPPRKRAPRPKKYKIQIPKGKNSISLPYEYDPQFRRELERERARQKEEAEAAAKAKKRSAKKASGKKPVAKKAPAKKPVAKKKKR